MALAEDGGARHHGGQRGQAGHYVRAGLSEGELVAWRPLLSARRTQTQKMCGLLGLPYVDDPTNAVLRHPRVVLRAEVLPRLEQRRAGSVGALAHAAHASFLLYKLRVRRGYDLLVTSLGGWR